MTSGQKVGAVLAGVALGLWLVVAVAVVLTPSDEGANIVAGLIGLLAIALSVLAAVLIIRGTDAEPPRLASTASIGLWAVFVAMAWGEAATDGARFAAGLGAIAALSLSIALVATGRRRQPPS